MGCMRMTGVPLVFPDHRPTLGLIGLNCSQALSLRLLSAGCCGVLVHSLYGLDSSGSSQNPRGANSKPLIDPCQEALHQSVTWGHLWMMKTNVWNLYGDPRQRGNSFEPLQNQCEESLCTKRIITLAPRPSLTYQVHNMGVYQKPIFVDFGLCLCS